jgi:hypothetical protein
MVAVVRYSIGATTRTLKTLHRPWNRNWAASPQ